MEALKILSFINRELMITESYHQSEIMFKQWN